MSHVAFRIWHLLKPRSALVDMKSQIFERTMKVRRGEVSPAMCTVVDDGCAGRGTLGAMIGWLDVERPIIDERNPSTVDRPQPAAGHVSP